VEIPEEPPLRDLLALAALSHDLRLAADDRSRAPVGDPQGMFPNRPAKLGENPGPIPLICPLAQLVNSVFEASPWHGKTRSQSAV